ncbi:MAG TPA: hypothetical protein VF884_03100 [Nitrososphaeraceae archaeon]
MHIGLSLWIIACISFFAAGWYLSLYFQGQLSALGDFGKIIGIISPIVGVVFAIIKSLTSWLNEPRLSFDLVFEQSEPHFVIADIGGGPFPTRVLEEQISYGLRIRNTKGKGLVENVEVILLLRGLSLVGLLCGMEEQISKLGALISMLTLNYSIFHKIKNI